MPPLTYEAVEAIRERMDAALIHKFGDRVHTRPRLWGEGWGIGIAGYGMGDNERKAAMAVANSFGAPVSPMEYSTVPVRNGLRHHHLQLAVVNG